MFFGFSNQPNRGGPPVVKKKMQPMSFGGGIGPISFGNPGFNKKKNSSINKGDWDRDGVSNMFDCRPMNFRQQDFKRNQQIINQKLRERFKETEEPRLIGYILSDGGRIDLNMRAHDAAVRDIRVIKESPSRGTGTLKGDVRSNIRAAQLGAGAIRVHSSPSGRSLSVDISAQQEITNEQKEALRKLESESLVREKETPNPVWYNIRKNDGYNDWAGPSGMTQTVDDVLDIYEQVHEETYAKPVPEVLQSIDEPKVTRIDYPGEEENV